MSSRSARQARCIPQPIVVDSGPLIAIANTDDEWHTTCMEWIESVSTRQLIVPALVLAEVCYTINDRQGATVEAAFLRGFAASSQFVLQAPDGDALNRMAFLVEKYGDWPLGGTDASVVAIAEQYRTPYVATVDRRHFQAIVPHHVPSFTLFPLVEPR